jgi:peptide/nickel transport system permease protein
VQYARTVRSLVLVERRREYVLAASVTGVATHRILFGHILPNVLRPVLVVATINLALAIVAEATLSFLGVGIPPTQPSLGTLVRVGGEFLFSGDWWITMLPGGLLVLLSVAVNLFGDWLRDTLNPRLDAS